MIISFWEKIVRKKDQPWKVDIYSGIKGEKSHEHKTLSGSSILNGEVIGGDIYYFRNLEGNILVNLNEKGESLV
ncbi:MAG: hypothetical protein Q8L29_03455 [archaeon]|nr:hypothetical protein [archaeon]